MAHGLQSTNRIRIPERLSVPRVELSVNPSSHGLAGRNRAAAADHKPPASPFSALLEPPTDASASARDRSQPPAASRTAARSGEARTRELAAALAR